MIEKAKHIVSIDVDRDQEGEQYRRKLYYEYFEKIGMEYMRKTITHIPHWISWRVDNNYGRQAEAFAEIVVQMQGNDILDRIKL